MSSSFHLANGKPKTVIVTGGTGGIGAQTVRAFHEHGCNVVVADLAHAKDAAKMIIDSLSDATRAVYHPTNIVDWKDMQALFRATKERFGQVDIVIANAGIMESKGFFEFEEDENGELKESEYASKVIDVNLKGTMNTLRLAMHAMKSNPLDAHGFRGSILAIASTSGYFGGTGVVSYVTSKHGVVGLCRASQPVAKQLCVRVNIVAPFVTPTYITGGYSGEWAKRGLPANTVEDVATAIVETSVDPARSGHSVMVAGKMTREIEASRAPLVKAWLGEEIADLMAVGGKFFDEIRGYPLPAPRE